MCERLSARLNQFIRQGLVSGCVWGLRSAAGDWSVTESNVNSTLEVMPFWSSEIDAEKVCHQEWFLYSATPIDLEEFLEDWLPGMHQDYLQVGVNWCSDLQGDEIAPLDLMELFASKLD
ncbi:MAG: hypothetical protein CMK30_00730 [Porticoccaceae bacterium]|nr:hypothetical protein [Porticoccaceae bacterium]|tara:strand:- start:10583 stop:10939 length:357 start_codon:yes stop_codon:yes gene_type:complete